MTRRRLPALALASAALFSAVAVIVAPVGSVSAATGTVSRVLAAGHTGLVGVDAIYGSAGAGGPYDVYRLWDVNGAVQGSLTVAGSPSRMRFEFYPDGHSYDAWALNVGGVHVDRYANQGFNLGEIPLPIDGVNGFRIDGLIVSSTPVPNDRIEIDLFQIATAYPDPPMPLVRTASGVDVGAFASSKNRGARWTGGVGWTGRYIIFIRDTATGRNVHGLADISPGSIPTLDLDAVCFGLDTCVYDQGAAGTTAGRFHPLNPTRILDTRIGLGIANGPVRTGEGRHSSLDPLTRRDEAANHEVKVTGRFGVPASGVSAVLLNVTAVGAPGPGFLTVSPKPASVGDVFYDQASFGGVPNSSNLNVAGGDNIPNMVLARVGAGGKIRIYNSLGPTHVIADVAGWFDSTGAAGEGFTGVVPGRLLDTRLGTGGPRRAFAAGETRTLLVAGERGVPTNATSVVLNITAADPSGSGYLTAYPAGQKAPNASNVNYAAGVVRANLAVVKVGEGGRIALHVAESSTHLIVDVMGSFGPGGGRVTPTAPNRIADSRSGWNSPARPMNQFEARTFGVAGMPGVPANATAAVLNVTAVSPTWFGYLTVWPTGSPRPKASNLNFRPGENVPNLVIVKLGTGGTISVYNELGQAHVLIDLMGYIT